MTIKLLIGILLFFVPVGYAETIADIPGVDHVPAFRKSDLSVSTGITRIDVATLHPKNNRRIFTSSGGGFVRLTDLCSGRNLWEFKRPGLPTFVPLMVVSPAGRYVFTVDVLSRGFLLDGVTGQLIRELDLQEDNYYQLPHHAVFSADERFVFVAMDRYVRKVDLSTGKIVRDYGRDRRGSLDSAAIAILPDGRPFLLSLYGETATWEVENPMQPQIVIPNSGRDFDTCLLDPRLFGGRFIPGAEFSFTHRFYLVDVNTGRPAQRFTGHVWSINDMELTADLRLTFSVGRDATLRIWETRTGRELAAYATTNAGNDPQASGSLALDPAGQFVVAGMEDGTLVIYESGDEEPTGLCR